MLGWGKQNTSYIFGKICPQNYSQVHFTDGKTEAESGHLAHRRPYKEPQLEIVS